MKKGIGSADPIIGIIHPTSMIIEMHNPDLDAIALQIEEKLINVMDRMKG